MSSIVEYDTGPLSWVKAEIDHALQKTRGALQEFRIGQDDPALLRNARTYLNQVSGAIEMVGLQGVTLLAQEARKLLAHLEDRTRPADAATIDLLLRSVDTLSVYLDDLLKGKPNLELSLYPLYQEMRIASGNEQSAESDLFFPDLELRAPKAQTTVQYSDAELAALVKKSRAQFQRGLLAFLRQQNADQGLTAMHDAVRTIEQAVALPANRTLWWGATAFVDCLTKHAIEPNFAVKQLCGRIDLQMRRQAEGSHKIAGRLLKDILYFVAKSNDVSEQVRAVKQTFSLDRLIPGNAAASIEMAAQAPLLKELRILLAPVKECWLKFTSGNSASLAQFQAQVSELQTRVAELNCPPLLSLLAKINDIAASVETLGADRAELLGLEIATALLLIQNTLENYQNITGELEAQTDVQVQRLRAAAYGDVDVTQIPEIPLLDEMSRQAQERLLIAQVAHEVQANLQQIEEILDAFFRDPLHDSVSLDSINAPLAQVQGALSILQLDEAGQLLSATRVLLQDFQNSQSLDEAHFVVVADALSSLGLYIDALRHQRHDAISILIPALHQLGLDAPQPLPADLPTESAAPSVEDGLAALKRDLQNDLAAWQRTPGADTQKKFLGTLRELGEDAELISDHALKQQTAEALRLAGNGSSAALIQVVQEIGKEAAVAAVYGSEIPVQQTSSQAVDAELLEIFLEEAREVLGSITHHLQICRVEPHKPDSLTTLRRNFHTLKGSGRMVGLTDLGEVAWSIEQLLNQWLQDEKPADGTLVALLDDAHQHFEEWISTLQSSGYANISAQALIANAMRLRNGESPESAVPQIAPAALESSATPTAHEISAEFAPSAVAIPAPETGILQIVAPEMPATQMLEAEAVPESEPDDLHRILETRIGESPPPSDDRVCIGANLISVPLLDIFLREAEQHCAMLQSEYTRLQVDPSEPVGYDFMRAAHTLAGIAGTTGFTPIADLAQALEAWLTQLHESIANLPPGTLTSDTITTLSMMLDSVRARQAPVPAHALIADLVAVQAATLESEARLAETENPVFVPEPAVELYTEPALLPDPPGLQRIPVIEEPEFTALLAAVGEQAPLHTIVDDLDDQLLPIFLEEAAELIPKISAESRQWRAHPDQEDAPASLQRLLHTLKGSARMAGAMRIGELTHIMETQVANVLESGALDAADFDAFEIELDRLNDALQLLFHPAAYTPHASGTVPTSPEPNEDGLHAFPTALATPLAEAENSARMLRVRADTVDRLVNEAGEVSITRSRLESSVGGIKQGAVELAENIGRLRAQLRELEIQAESQMQSTLSQMHKDDLQFDPLEFDRFTRLQELTRMIAESINDVGTVQQNITVGLNETEAALTQQGRMTRDLQQALMHIRMVPLASIADRLHRTVRRAAKDMNKKASLQIIGDQVEMDRSVLEKMVAPFEHLLRNAVAHGVELPAERIQAGKSEYGEIVLHARQEGNEIMLSLRDDGCGLNLDAIRAHAIAKGLLEPEINVAPNQLMQFIFAPGFSTAETITEISGRGIGMDVVKSEITSLGGRLEVSSEPGKGAHFMVYLPLTLAVTSTVLVTAGGHQYALPSTMVEQVQEYKTKALAEVLATGSIEWQGNRYTLFYLPHLLGETGQVHLPQRYNAVILLRSGKHRSAVLVDELTGNREVVVKNIGPQLARVSGIAGATVLGHGQVVLIINPVQLALQHGEHMRSAVLRTPDVDTARAILVMVVDDSLTVRKITSRLLTREGYAVITAKDGVDALQMLQDARPDVMLLDIEMPRMDGFELTNTMRADAQLAAIPIIMITSRTADKHRDHAFSLGVNAYLGKPFQEEELLAKIAELVDHKNMAIA